MNDFLYTALPLRVRFERGGRWRVGDEMALIGRTRAMVLTTPGRRALAEGIVAALGEACVGVLDTARMHAPVEVTEAALGELANVRADCTIAVGGGSVIGLGKAIALRDDIPQIALPTTYAGSEMTTVLGQTENRVKTTSKDPRLLPAAVIYDVDVTLTLPPRISVTSGLNAIAHAIEALYAREKNPVSTAQCLEAIRALSEALPVVVEKPGDIDARSRALYGAFLSGMALGSAGMALHHKLCHTLGGSFDLPHADTHAVVLPHAAGFNAQEAPELDPVIDILGADSVGGGLWDLAKRLRAPTSLAEIGMPADGIERAADIAAANPYWNPRAFDRSDLKALIEQAYAGERPRT
ncbi:MAG: maleylacetate reductase [Alphaproteobacteria bacterium]|nr:maleylacetate reductase [Alphaproteobacteria bacterium]